MRSTGAGPENEGNMLTVEKIEETILHRLHDGRGRAAGRRWGCRYRTSTGIPCVVGAIIPDECYDPEMEGVQVHSLVVRDGVWAAPATEPFVAAAVALANALNKAKIPATDEIHFVLKNWQLRHDEANNWEGTTYIGPTESLLKG